MGVETLTCVSDWFFPFGCANAHTTSPLHPLRQSVPPELISKELINSSAPGAILPVACVSTGWTVSTYVDPALSLLKPFAVTADPDSISALLAARTWAYLKI